jgi:malonyl-CoA O-methyltransferase
MLKPRDIRRRFDRAAASFDDADFVHAVTRDGLLSRLEPLVIEGGRLLDLGSATGSSGRRLRKRFRRAHVVSLDLSYAMLQRARGQKSWLAKSSFVQADARRLPFAPGSFDLVVANQLLPWVPDPQPLFAEVARVLRKGGVFAFATLGPDSLQELARAGLQVNPFADMHDIGDGLVRAGLSDPVLDVDRLQISYNNVDHLFADLTHMGARNTAVARQPGLTGRQVFGARAASLTQGASDGRILLNLELVYGHCWGSGRGNDPTVTIFDANSIPLRR